ncbi:MAG: GNAT family N-acetyltransferase [Actinomycetota bacterium]
MTEPITIEWRGVVTSTEVNRVHAAAFDTRVFADAEWDWAAQLAEHSMGWVTARLDGELVGFLNVITDGFVHAWLQDVVVDPAHQRSGIGAAMVEAAAERCRAAGCEWLHVDFDEENAAFYYDGCGFTPTKAGLRAL